MVRVHPCLPFAPISHPRSVDRFRMSQITVTLPDGSSRTVPAGTPVRDIAVSDLAGSRKAALAGIVDGRLVDSSYPLDATRPSGSSPTAAPKRWRCTATARRTCWPPR